jgi:hypothetical protein
MIILQKTAHGFVPTDQKSAEKLAKYKVGDSFTCTIKRVRNIKFLRKYFALINHAYECWEPETKQYKGKEVKKNKERFRKDIQILAGYYEATVNLKGDVRLESKSIAFESMKEEDFEKLYQSVITVIMEKVLTNYTRDDIDRVVDELLKFT